MAKVRKKGFVPYNKIIWTSEMDQYIFDNWEHKTNKQIADGLGLKLTSVRTRIYSLGLLRMELEYWTPSQVLFLMENYRELGDTEIAEIFSQEWPEKKKGWTKKHIEKKRRYLKLKRTPEEREAIFKRNVANGRFALCPVRAWETRGQAPAGEIRVWHLQGSKYPTKYIKTSEGWRKLSHINWINKNGEIPEEYIIIHIDGDAMNCEVENLNCITKSENMDRNSGSKNLTDNYVASMMSHKNPEMKELVKTRPDLIDLKRTQLQLNRTITQQKNG